MTSTHEQAFDWHRKNGGRNDRLAGHALRLLNEAIELCAAAGATGPEIIDRVFLEVARQEGEGNLGITNNGAVREELADVTILADVLAGHTGNVSLEGDRSAKLEILHGRSWEVDKDGVLWRPGRIPEGLERPPG